MKNLGIQGMNETLERLPQIVLSEHATHYDVYIDGEYNESFNKPSWTRNRLIRKYKLTRDNWSWIQWNDER